MEITIQPTKADDLNGIDTTTLEITVDVTSIMHLMKTHYLILKTTLEVETQVEEITKQMTYQFAQVYETIDNPKLTYQAIVMGQITDVAKIQGRAEGTMVLRVTEGGE